MLNVSVRMNQYMVEILLPQPFDKRFYVPGACLHKGQLSIGWYTRVPYGV